MKNAHDCFGGSACIAALLLIGVTGCAESAANRPATTDVRASAAVTPASVKMDAPETTLTDGQIVGVASAANEAQIAAGKLAMPRASSAKTRAFAEHMVAAHRDMNAGVASIAESQGIAVGESNLCKKLKTDTAAEGQTLAAMTGAPFDREDITAQRKGHEDVLALLDSTLIQNARNPTLKTALQETRAKVVEHPQMAKDAESSLGH